MGKGGMQRVQERAGGKGEEGTEVGKQYVRFEGWSGRRKGRRGG